jgi:hypothetical protein
MAGPGRTYHAMDTTASVPRGTLHMYDICNDSVKVTTKVASQQHQHLAASSNDQQYTLMPLSE